MSDSMESRSAIQPDVVRESENNALAAITDAVTKISSDDNGNRSQEHDNFTRNIVRESLKEGNSGIPIITVTHPPKTIDHDCQLNNNVNNEKEEEQSRVIWQVVCPCFGFLKTTKENEKNRADPLKKLSRVATDTDIFLCELEGTSEIMSPIDIRNICKHLPPRAIGFTWILTFSTALHGFSLHNLYRKMYKIDSPTLLLIQDVKNRVFGALVSCSLKISDNFYGTSQSMLIRCRPDFQVFKWNGENFYFIQGEEDALSFGAGNGKFGLWLDGDLNKGRTEECATYGSPALIEEQDFIVKTLECWTFG